MIKINLVSEARAAAAKKGAPAVTAAPGKSNNLLFIACIALGLLYIAGMWWHLKSVSDDYASKIRSAQQEVDRLKSIIEEVNGYEKKKANLEAKINLINELKRNQKGPVRLMDEVSRALPDLVWLTDMSVASNVITIRGKSMTPNAVANFIENMKKSSYFAEPTFDSMTQEQGIYNFGFSVTFTYGQTTTSTATTTTSTGSPARGAAAPGTKPAV
jgi:type IV pilus assembly protein PilN